MTKQLHKLVNVIKIRDLEPAEAVSRELALFKISVDGDSRGQIMEYAEIFRGRDRGRVQALGDRRGHRAPTTRSRRSSSMCRPVRADRDGPHRRDRGVAWPRRYLAPSSSAAFDRLADRAEEAERLAVRLGLRTFASVTVPISPEIDPSATILGARAGRGAVLLHGAAEPRRLRRVRAW